MVVVDADGVGVGACGQGQPDALGLVVHAFGLEGVDGALRGVQLGMAGRTGDDGDVAGVVAGVGLPDDFLGFSISIRGGGRGLHLVLGVMGACRAHRRRGAPRDGLGCLS